MNTTTNNHVNGKHRPAPCAPAACPAPSGTQPASIAEQHSEMIRAMLDALTALRRGIRGDFSGLHAAESILEGCLAEVSGNAP